MLPVLTSAQMQQIDRETIEVLGLPGAVLMETAGRAVVKAIDRHPRLGRSRRVLILCGKGNNGGDGFVVARHLQQRCREGFPLVLLCGKLGELSVDASTMARVAENCGIRIVELSKNNLHELAQALDKSDLVVDALIGSGAAGAPRGLIGSVIELIREYQVPVVAIDSPSGVEMDTGQVPASALAAELTVTFGFEKIGHRLYPGRSVCGEVVVADIGFPEITAAQTGCRLFVSQAADINNRMPLRRPNSHKGDYGKILVVGGSTGLTGAPVLTSEAALACGAGMVTAAVPASLNAIFETRLTETMTLPLADNGRGELQPEALETILDALSAGMDVLALGPGLGRHKGTVKLVNELVRKLELPAVMDADGLNAFAGSANAFASLKAPVVITPHPGEMARLAGMSVEKVRKSPIETARSYAADNGVVVLLKGAPSVVAHPDGRAILNPTGGPWMSKAGSGDVLTGIIAALLAQGLQPFDAAFCGAYLHGLAGDIAAEELGEYSPVASDMIGCINKALIRVSESSSHSV